MTPEQAVEYSEANHSIERLLRLHPAPWRYVSHEATIYMADANNTLVELFDMLDFCTAQTKIIALQSAAMPQPTETHVA